MSCNNLDKQLKKQTSENETLYFLEQKIIEEYKKLSQQCDMILSKIISRKNTS
jgi:hypothetical protein